MLLKYKINPKLQAPIENNCGFDPKIKPQPKVIILQLHFIRLN